MYLYTFITLTEKKNVLFSDLDMADLSNKML